jgi:hypothetical protein
VEFNGNAIATGGAVEQPASAEIGPFGSIGHAGAFLS